MSKLLDQIMLSVPPAHGAGNDLFCADLEAASVKLIDNSASGSRIVLERRSTNGGYCGRVCKLLPPFRLAHTGEFDRALGRHFANVVRKEG